MRTQTGTLNKIAIAAFTLSLSGLLWSSSAQAQTPIIQYNFTAAGATSSGSDTSAGLTYVSTTPQAKTSTVTGPGGSPVTVFDNTSATGMGSSGTGGYATNSAALTSLTGLSSLTMTGWMYTPTVSSGLAPTARIFVNGNTTNGIILYSNGSGLLELKNNATRLLDSSTGAYSTGGGWTFFAVTYSNDATVSGSTTVGANLSNFYEATASAPSLINVTPSTSPITSTTNYVALAGGTTAPTGVADFGNISSLARPYDGYLYDFRVYGSTNDNSGALTTSQISAIETSALSAPEPSSLLILTLPMLMLGAAILRRKQQS
jgi:hypothetical protein